MLSNPTSVTLVHGSVDPLKQRLLKNSIRLISLINLIYLGDGLQNASYSLATVRLFYQNNLRDENSSYLHSGKSSEVLSVAKCVYWSYVDNLRHQPIMSISAIIFNSCALCDADHLRESASYALYRAESL